MYLEDYTFKYTTKDLINTSDFKKKVAKNKLLTGKEFYSFDNYDGFYIG